MDAALDQIGPRLRAARRDRGWTLEDLATRAGMSASTLSRLESGKRQASLALLLPLTRQLGLRIDDLLPATPADPRIRRPVERRDGMVIAPLTLEHSPIKTYKVTFPPAEEAPAPRVHDGYEWVFVLSGRLRLALDGHEHLIERGEAAEFDTRTPHSLSATAEGPVEVVSIFSASGERIHTRGVEAQPDGGD
ncbi:MULTISPECIES: helix-turn-helix domain-containing protein [Microbacterium]|uniref:XRE family transcriptional regulator n=1 Tax=Microbacterium wangchenii TaxID=2541726 RepID=A0ABX5SSN8_9MICO|nr:MULTISPECIES: XRE family transcriptional regulator [Microbacterium]MCK6067968.1 XRE family transcriptional regulator [Microbacterium sp. EYE_512]QBR87889.1 XRE family transcriptional regulator [Microbacterium wangchenii]TXK16183.1 helix-turn-helix transcriptional regulator [Microbacterium wangchenii]